MLNEFYSSGNYDKKRIREPRGNLLILDRSFDLIAPIVHDYYYQTNVADFKEGLGVDGSFKMDNNKTVLLNDQDELWVRLRNTHCVEVYQTVN